MRAAVPTGFYGREPELAALEALWRRAASGHLGVVLVEGEAGIGKSRLLAEGLELALRQGLSLLVGAADELAARPFGAIAEAVGSVDEPDRPLAAEVAALLAGAAEELDPGLRYRMLDRLIDLLEASALRRPCALVLEDLHWADPSTLMAVGTAARRLTSFPVAIVTTFRSAPRSAALDRLVDTLTRERAAHLRLGPLADDAVAALAGEIVRAEPGPRLLQQLGGTAGNPLFVRELLAVLLEEGDIETGDGRAEAREVSLPRGLSRGHSCFA